MYGQVGFKGLFPGFMTLPHWQFAAAMCAACCQLSWMSIGPVTAYLMNALYCSAALMSTDDITSLLSQVSLFHTYPKKAQLGSAVRLFMLIIWEEVGVWLFKKSFRKLGLLKKRNLEWKLMHSSRFSVHKCCFTHWVFTHLLFLLCSTFTCLFKIFQIFVGGYFWANKMEMFTKLATCHSKGLTLNRGCTSSWAIT